MARKSPEECGAPEGTPGRAIWNARKQHKPEMTQKQLEALSHVSQPQISLIETNGGANTSASTLFQLADALEIDTREALRGRVVRLRRPEEMSADARRLDAALSKDNHARWIAYGHGLLASQTPPERAKKK